MDELESQRLLAIREALRALMEAKDWLDRNGYADRLNSIAFMCPAPESCVHMALPQSGFYRDNVDVEEEQKQFWVLFLFFCKHTSTHMHDPHLIYCCACVCCVCGVCPQPLVEKGKGKAVGHPVFSTEKKDGKFAFEICQPFNDKKDDNDDDSSSVIPFLFCLPDASGNDRMFDVNLNKNAELIFDSDSRMELKVKVWVTEGDELQEQDHLFRNLHTAPALRYPVVASPSSSFPSMMEIVCLIQFLMASILMPRTCNITNTLSPPPPQTTLHICLLLGGLIYSYVECNG
jgi:hypothetical protein